MFPKRKVLFDIETTGFANTDRIIEIGAIRTVDGQITGELSLLVNPYICIPAKIKTLTGITDEAAGKGIDEKQAIAIFLAFVGSETLVAHNAAFDTRFLKRILPIPNKTIDSLEVLRKYVPGLKSYSLQNLAKQYGIEPGGHRALDDAKCLNQIINTITHADLAKKRMELVRMGVAGCQETGTKQEDL